MAGDRLEQPPRGIDLELGHAERQFNDVRMRKRVVADVVAFLVFALDNIRRGTGIFTDDEEGGFDVLCLQDVENLRRPGGVWPVVEGQRDFFWLGAEALDDERGRQSFIVLIDDVARLGVQLVDTLAARGLRRNVQDFALILEIDFLVAGIAFNASGAAES